LLPLPLGLGARLGLAGLGLLRPGPGDLRRGLCLFGGPPLPQGRTPQPAEQGRQEPEHVDGGQGGLSPGPLRGAFDEAGLPPAPPPATRTGRPPGPPAVGPRSAGPFARPLRQISPPSHGSPAPRLPGRSGSSSATFRRSESGSGASNGRAPVRHS